MNLCVKISPLSGESCRFCVEISPLSGESGGSGLTSSICDGPPVL